MAKAIKYQLLKSTKLGGNFVTAGQDIELDPQLKATKDLVEKGIIGKPGQASPKNDGKVAELEEALKVSNGKVAELEEAGKVLEGKVTELEKDLETANDKIGELELSGDTDKKDLSGSKK